MARIPLPPPLDSGAFSTRDARGSGLGRGRLRGPDLGHPFRGAYLPSPTDDLELLCRALQTRTPRDAFLCGITAARLWGAPLPRWAERGALHVALASGTAPTGRGIVGHRLTIDPVDVVVRSGLSLTSPARTWCDLAGSLGLADLVAVGDYLLHHRHPLVLRRELESLVARRPGRRGVRLLRLALPMLSDRAESRRESRLRVLLMQAGFSGVAVNLWIVTSGGYRYRADLAFPDRKVIIEYQSAFHDDPTAQRDDMTRRSRLQADGWIVIEVHRDDLADPAELFARIRRTLALR